MSFQVVETPQIIGLSEVNGKPFTFGGVGIHSNNVSNQDLLLFTTATVSSSSTNFVEKIKETVKSLTNSKSKVVPIPATQVTSLQANPFYFVNPANGQLNAGQFRSLTSFTSYGGSPATITAASLFNQLLLCTNAGATVWNFDTTPNILAAFNFTVSGETVIVRVINPSGSITFNAGDGSTNLVGAAAQNSSFEIIIQNAGSGIINIYI